MHCTRRQKAKARKSREMDFLSDYDNMDIMLWERNSNSVKMELDNNAIGPPDRTSSLYLIREALLKKMRSEKLIIEMAKLGKMDSQSLLRYYQVK